MANGNGLVEYVGELAPSATARGPSVLLRRASVLSIRRREAEGSACTSHQSRAGHATAGFRVLATVAPSLGRLGRFRGLPAPIAEASRTPTQTGWRREVCISHASLGVVAECVGSIGIRCERISSPRSAWCRQHRLTPNAVDTRSGNDRSAAPLDFRHVGDTLAMYRRHGPSNAGFTLLPRGVDASGPAGHHSMTRSQV